MNTRTKILLTLFFAFILFFIAFILLQQNSEKQYELSNNIQNQERHDALKAIIDVKVGFMADMVKDYSCYNEMIDFAQHPDSLWAKENISIVAYFKMDANWIFNKDGKLVFSEFSEKIKKPIQIPEELFDSLIKNKKCNIFIKSERNLIQIIGSTIHTSKDFFQITPAQGFFLVGKIWDAELISQLESATKSKIHLSFDTIVNRNKQVIVIDVFDIFGKKITSINSFKTNPILDSIRENNKTVNYLILIFFALILIIFFVAFTIFVLSPLSIIEKTLNTEDQNKLVHLCKKKDEFGKISVHITQFFEQKMQLEEEITERINKEELLNMLNTELILQKQEILVQRDRLKLLNNKLEENNGEITNQNNEIIRQKNQITDSIRYASRIQNAAMPTDTDLNSFFKNYFLIFKPQSIVSGDFLLVKKINENLVIAVADCTGHGVPGALMSMLGIAYLNEIINRPEVKNTSQALAELRKLIISSLNQTGKIEEAKDGMDISLCLLNTEKLTLQFSGAFQDVCIFRNNEMIEIKGDPIPVGIHRLDKNFTEVNFNLQKNDIFYLFSDGYLDQLGGPASKRFTSKKFKLLLHEIHQLPLEEQKLTLETTIENWRLPEFEQLDDILILGIKI